ncbi:MAG: hypothetical protein HZC54_11430 [Verrucomicrobia bacterium]|nr:hypothetical protein [Verrucomicrobiota bacterium]
MPTAKSQHKTFGQSPFIRMGMEVGQAPELRRDLIKRIEDHYECTVVTFFTSFTKQDVAIVDTDAEMLESLLSVEHKGGKLMLVLNSPGGQALAAERIVNVCRAYSKNQFEVIVPHMAKSAATMICFGSAKIHMSKTAELGPVDPQVPYWAEGDKEDDPSWISAEEYIRSYDKLMNFASSGKAKRLEPYIQQLGRYDARYIERLRSVQKLSEDISVRLLKSLMMKGKSSDKIRNNIDVFLTQKRTSSHGRMINYEDAGSCGLKIGLIDLGSDVWHSLWELYVRSNWSTRHNCGKVIETSTSAVSA